MLADRFAEQLTGYRWKGMETDGKNHKTQR